MPRRIFIGNLNLTTTDATINRTFAPYGTLVSAAVDRDATGQSLGTANAEYTTEAAGTAAIAAKDGTVLDGSTITVS